jgi:hypothetical protein
VFSEILQLGVALGVGIVIGGYPAWRRRHQHGRMWEFQMEASAAMDSGALQMDVN